MFYINTIKFKCKKIIKLIFLFIFSLILCTPIELSSMYHTPFIENFSIIFSSIILESVPFILLASLVSALIQVFVSEEFITKIIPKNKFLSFLGASLMGLIFPVCECAIVPITKKLIKKGVPVEVSFTFMLSVPIVNPIVLMSTYYAFYNKPSIFILRAIFGILIPIIIGLITSNTEEFKIYPIKESIYESYNVCNCGCSNNPNLYINDSKLRIVLEHTIKELFTISKYLILGAFISTLFQLTISKQFILPISENSILSILVMIILAFTLSICSEADAFIASTFLNQFTMGSIVSFLILGPMIDIKNALMLLGTFKKNLVLRLIFYIFSLSYIVGILINILKGLGVI
ncbi:permease [Clostridium tetani]|uniref:Permease n=1 Tax=Clostridium tetani TaxID=1513 RepID=A0A4Q0UYF6_CLOTA|nr:permease [Clostridium tetani]AVP54358.1 permease [Clostridium tetani]RXI38557.1 permease [Clostridium tetani]RXI46415.1 permease [Clostridium tetani]RXI50526.1 permease [Clostridium tetani]RXI56868.1 permease [Clostridium tetani]